MYSEREQEARRRTSTAIKCERQRKRKRMESPTTACNACNGTNNDTYNDKYRSSPGIGCEEYHGVKSVGGEVGACAPGGVQSVTTRRGRAEEGGGERRGGGASLPNGLKREGICSFSLNPSRSTLPNNPFTLHTPSPPTLCPELEDMDKTFSIFTLITLHWLGRQTKTKRPARELLFLLCQFILASRLVCASAAAVAAVWVDAGSAAGSRANQGVVCSSLHATQPCLGAQRSICTHTHE